MEGQRGRDIFPPNSKGNEDKEPKTMEGGVIAAEHTRLIMKNNEMKGIAKQTLRSTAERGTNKLLLYPNSCNLKHRGENSSRANEVRRRRPT